MSTAAAPAALQLDVSGTPQVTLTDAGQGRDAQGAATPEPADGS